MLARSEAIARLAICPGYGDHSGRYLHFMRWMASRGVSCHALDFRGHGLSTGRRGYVRRWDDFLEDLHAFLTLPALAGEGPLFLLGHSHGGLIVATAGTRGLLDGVAGCVLISPFLRPILPIPILKLMAARVANVCMPWLRVASGLSPDMMSNDAAMVEDSRHDPLLLRCATPRWFFSTLHTQAKTRAAAGDFQKSLLCFAASDDVIADPKTTEDFTSHVGSADRTFHLAVGRKHELLRDMDRETTFAMLHSWIRGRAATP